MKKTATELFGAINEPGEIVMVKEPLFNRCHFIDVSDIARKNYQGIRYLSWADAWARLKMNFPYAKFTVHNYPESPDFAYVEHTSESVITKGKRYVPYLKTEFGCFVTVSVTIEEITMTETLPVMDNKMHAVEKPNARDINDNTKRCLVKAMALHGFGLSLYESDDIYETEPVISHAQQQRLFAIAKSKAISDDKIRSILNSHDYESSKEILKSDYDLIIKEIEDYK